MKGHRGRLRAGVVDEPGCGNETCEGSDGDDGAVVGSRDSGEKFAREAVVREGVDGEDAFEEDVWKGEERASVHNAGVENEDGRGAVSTPDGGSGGSNGRRRREVQREVVHAGIGCGGLGFGTIHGGDEQHARSSKVGSWISRMRIRALR